MEKTRIIFIRHGQSEGNLHNLFIGQGNAPLTERGKEQAMAAAEYLKDEKIDFFYASDLARAYETGKIVAERHNMVPYEATELREIFAGEWEGKSFNDLGENNDDFKLWLTDIGSTKATDGESVAELFERVNNFVEEMAKKHRGKTIAMATHATPIRAVLTRVKGYSVKDMMKVPWTANASITIIDFYEDKSVKIIEEGNADFQGELKTALPRGV